MTLKRTPLYEEHQKLNGKIVPFAGWELPVLYSGVIAEHHAVRNAAGLFDVSHMGEIFVEGAEAEAAIDDLTCNKVAALYDGKALYSAIINEKGGVEDDIIIYRYSSQKYLICVNASNADHDFEWFTKHNKRDAVFTNKSSEYGQIALQGPKAQQIIAKIEGAKEASNLKYFHFCEAEICGARVIVARTGYTGEDGFEIFTPTQSTAKIWTTLLEAGKGDGLIACGLGARDTLRLEACYPLHGHELSPEVSAIESGLSWIVKPEKGEFIGKNILAEQKANGSLRSLVGFVVEDAGIVREQTKLFSIEGAEIGVVTSGTKSPTLERALGMAFVNSDFKTLDTQIKAEVRGKLLNCQIAKLPFYKRA